MHKKNFQLKLRFTVVIFEISNTNSVYSIILMNISFGYVKTFKDEFTHHDTFIRPVSLPSKEDPIFSNDATSGYSVVIFDIQSKI